MRPPNDQSTQLDVHPTSETQVSPQTDMHRNVPMFTADEHVVAKG